MALPGRPQPVEKPRRTLGVPPLPTTVRQVARLYPHPVPGKLHIEALGPPKVRKLATHVVVPPEGAVHAYQERAHRVQLAHQIQRIPKREMRGVGLAEEAVHHQYWKKDNHFGSAVHGKGLHLWEVNRINLE